MKRPGHFLALATALGLILVLLTAAHPASAQTATATLKGTITEENNRPVRDAKITVTNLTTKESKEVSTDNDGNYQLTGLVADRYEVKVDSPRHKNRRYPAIVLTSGEIHTLDVKLDPMGRAPSGGSKSQYAVCANYIYHRERFSSSTPGGGTSVSNFHGFNGCFVAPIGPIGIEAEGGFGIEPGAGSGNFEHFTWFTVGPVIPLTHGQRVTPYIRTGLGFAREISGSSGSSSADNSVAFRVGGGFLVRLTRCVQWNAASFDYFLTHFSSQSQHNFRIGSGIVFNFGGR
jgi:hypothetical protein